MEDNLETQVQEPQEPQTTQDVVAAEFEKLEQAQASEGADFEKVVEKRLGKGVVQEMNKDRARDESGKFTKKEEKPEENQEPEQPKEEATQEEQKPERNPYASWKKEAQAELSKLPENVQKMIQERESQFHKGIQTYKEDAVYGRNLKQTLSQFDPYLQELGVDAQVAIPQLLNTEMVLRKGSPEQKAQMFMQLAHEYGVDVNNLAQTPFNPVEYQLRQELAAIKHQVSGLGQSRQMAEEADLSQTIEQFAEGREYFEDVRETMADLLDRGLANDLDDAYAKALRLNDDVFSKWQANQQTTQERQRLEQANQAAKAAKAAAVSVKGSPTGSTRAPEPKTTEDAVRLAMAQLGF